MEELRKSGINVIGDVPWGTHLCLFYQNRMDLLDILVPYFRAGLENNEFCLWITSEPLDSEAAIEAMKKSVADFDKYLEKGQIEIIPHSEWYLHNGTLDLQRVTNSWNDKLNQALANGYAGMRVTTNTAWLEKTAWSLSAFGVGISLWLTGYNSELGGDQDPKTFLMMRLFLAGAPAITAIFALIALKFYPINAERAGETRRKLEEKRGKITV